MESSDYRTETMQTIFVKMKLLYRVALPLLEKLTQSNSVGERLMAVAILTEAPDVNYIQWLKERIRLEQPFFGYQVAIAFQKMAKIAGAEQTTIIRASVEEAMKYLAAKNLSATDRYSELKKALSQLP